MMGEKKYTKGGYPPTGKIYIQKDSELYIDDLIHDLYEKLVDDAGVEIGSGENVNEFKVSLSFNVDFLKNTFTWKLLFGSNNWRKLHGFNMRRKKCLR